MEIRRYTESNNLFVLLNEMYPIHLKIEFDSLNDISDAVVCVAYDDNDKIIGYGLLRNVTYGSYATVLEEYEGKGIEEELDEACWQYALKERPAVNSLLEDLPVLEDLDIFHDPDWNALRDELAQREQQRLAQREQRKLQKKSRKS